MGVWSADVQALELATRGQASDAGGEMQRALAAGYDLQRSFPESFLNLTSDVGQAVPANQTMGSAGDFHADFRKLERHAASSNVDASRLGISL